MNVRLESNPGESPLVTGARGQSANAPLPAIVNRGSCDRGPVSNNSVSKLMFNQNSSFPHHTLLANDFHSKHLAQVTDGNLGFFLPLPHHAGAPTFGPDRWLTVSGPGADGSLQNFAIHHAALVESNSLNRINLPAFFQLDALQDVDGFATALLNPDDPLARILRNRLPELGAWDGSSPIPKALASKIVTELNRVLKKPEKLSQIPFVDPPVGSFVESLTQDPDLSRKDKVLLVKSLIEDRYPTHLSRHRRLRSAYAHSNSVCFLVSFTVSQYGFGMPFPVRIVCRPNTCSKALAAAISRGEVTDIRIGGDIIGATFVLPPLTQPDKPGVVIDDARAFSIGFGADTGIKPPTTREEFNTLSARLSSEDPVAAEPLVSFNPFDTQREMGFEVERRLATAA